MRFKLKADKSSDALRRDQLLLAKELYPHGLEHSRLAGRLNHMIAVHNFHNAVEIVLRAIMLRYGIRPGKKMIKVSFEEMMEVIDKHFKEEDIELPRRDDLGVLNQKRNHVQHHGIGVAVEEMDLWRECIRDFMKKAYKQYFEVNFEALSRLDWIDDELLKEGLRLAEESCQDGKCTASLLLSKMVFQWASYSVWEFLPDDSSFDRFFADAIIDGPTEKRPQSGSTKLKKPSFEILAIHNYLKLLHTMVRESEYFAAVLSTGISLNAFKAFEGRTPRVLEDGRIPFWPVREPSKDDQQEAATAVPRFVIGTIINWQELGLEPKVPNRLSEAARRVLKEGDPSWDQFLNLPDKFPGKRSESQGIRRKSSLANRGKS